MIHRLPKLLNKYVGRPDPFAYLEDNTPCPTHAYWLCSAIAPNKNKARIKRAERAQIWIHYTTFRNSTLPLFSCNYIDTAAHFAVLNM